MESPRQAMRSKAATCSSNSSSARRRPIAVASTAALCELMPRRRRQKCYSGRPAKCCLVGLAVNRWCRLGLLPVEPRAAVIQRTSRFPQRACGQGTLKFSQGAMNRVAANRSRDAAARVGTTVYRLVSPALAERRAPLGRVPFDPGQFHPRPAVRRATNQRLKFNKSYTLLLRLRSAALQESTIARRVAR